jgi:hypothetical protein
MIYGQMAKMRAAGIACIAGAFLASTLAGCIKVDQTLILEKDGSGTIDLTYGMSEESISQWQDVARNMLDSSNPGSSSPVMPFDFSDEDVRNDFKEFEREGVALQSVKTEARDGWKFRRMVIGFKDLASLAKAGFLGDRNISLVKNPQGNYVFTQQVGREGNLPPELAAFTGTSADSLFSGMMQGFKAVIRVKTPGRILETNAQEKSERQAGWTFDLERDPEALQKVQEASLRIVFEGKGLDIPAFRSAPAKP